MYAWVCYVVVIVVVAINKSLSAIESMAQQRVQ